VTGSGKEGAITLRDVQRYGKQQKNVNGATPPAPPAPAAVDAGPTVDDVRGKLREVLDTKGGPIAQALMSDFNAANVTALMEEQYADFIAAADQLLAP